MWRHHPFSQRNKTTERTVGLGVDGDRKVGKGGEVGQSFKKEGWGRQ